MLSIIRTMIIATATLSIPLGVVAEALSFGPDSMREIERMHAGAPFIVALWATDCSPCRRELAVLRAFSIDHPGIPVVLIASDNIGNADLVEHILAEFGLADVESWLFSNGNLERLRYTVDPGWSGEMPRSYLYDENSKRQAIIGALSKAHLDLWIESLP
mgnify:CR=1 FL=1